MRQYYRNERNEAYVFKNGKHAHLFKPTSWSPNFQAFIGEPSAFANGGNGACGVRIEQEQSFPTYDQAIQYFKQYEEQNS